MKIRIEVDESLTEDIVTIQCRSFSENVRNIQQAIADVDSAPQTMMVYKDDTEYYVAIEDILFFETNGSSINVHTTEELYDTRYHLYELEELLPGHFIRVSKSTILNTDKVYAVSRNLSSVSVVSFYHTHKQVYVSRRYYHALQDKLSEKRKI